MGLTHPCTVGLYTYGAAMCIFIDTFCATKRNMNGATMVPTARLRLASSVHLLRPTCKVELMLNVPLVMWCIILIENCEAVSELCFGSGARHSPLLQQYP